MANQDASKQASGALRSDFGPGTSQDPSALTTQQLLRENFWLRELSEAKLDAVLQRISASDRAVELLQARSDRAPSTMDVQNAVAQLREVAFEKFDGVQTQLKERDVQIERSAKDVKEATEKAARDVKSAVDAAFAASKEVVSEQNKSNAAANDKSERAVTKQIDMLGDTIKVNTKGVDDKINDIKERITIIESKTSISDPSTAITLAKLDATVARLSSTTDVSGGRSAGMVAMWALVVGGIGLLLSVGTFVILVMKFVK